VILRPVLCRRFIGRRGELAYLHEARVSAAASHGAFVLVSGDAGIGKSRLLAEFCGVLANSRWRVAQGSCPEFGSRPYGPILEALGRVDAESAALGTPVTKHQQFEAIAERFRSIALRRALLVVIEDLHWADAATLEFLAYFGERIGNARILVATSMRPLDTYPEPLRQAVGKIARAARATRIDLEPLQGTELRSFIDGALEGIELPEASRRTVARISEGNPFFAEELLKSAVEHEGAGLRAPRLGSRPILSTTIRATLLERLSPFLPEERRVVEQAAVIGRSFSLHLLAQTLAADPSALLPALRRARDVQLIDEVTPVQFRFRHVLTREAVYGEFLGVELQERHRAIAQALESAAVDGAELEALAYHWSLAGDGAKALEYNERAGDAAARVYAHEDAIAFYERAAGQLGIGVLPRATLVHKIADRRLVLAATDEAFAAYNAAARLFHEAGEIDREAVCLARAAMTAYTMSLTDTAGPLLEALERIDPAEWLARSRLHLAIAWISGALRRPTRAREHLSQIDARATDAATDIAVRLHNVAASVAMQMGDVASLRAEIAAWLLAAERRNSGAVVGAYYNGALFLSALGRHDEALAHVGEALRRAREMQNRHAEECAQATAGLCHLAAGDLRRARAAVDAVPPTTDNRVNFVFAAAAATLIGAHTGDASLITTWFDGGEASIAAAPEPECAAGFAELLVRRGRERDAEALLHLALPDCEMIRGEVPTLLAVAKYGAAADRRRARTYLVRGAETGPDLVESPALALFDAYDARRAGRHEDVVGFAREAAAGFARLRFPLLEAEALETAGDIEAAAACYARCGATYHERRLASGGTPRGTAGTVTATAQSDGLSRREREVVNLAADGLSNLEIARRLSVSHKTVEKHLSAAFRKLEVGSRRGLRAYVTSGKQAEVMTS
jgi:DNA-binding CsgD family transcriptional regulator/tetratricopeptide (TPR) repeat protein/energy-coupling factor transporter ATP-binding protein EcfA2